MPQGEGELRVVVRVMVMVMVDELRVVVMVS
jgi:hypothetical protein